MRKLSETKHTIADSQKELNKRYGYLQTILNTLENYGVTDKDFENYQCFNDKPAYGLAHDLESAKPESFKQALDLCAILDSAKQPKRWLFSRRPSDQTTKALINQLKLLYHRIAG